MKKIISFIVAIIMLMPAIEICAANYETKVITSIGEFQVTTDYEVNVDHYKGNQTICDYTLSEEHINTMRNAVSMKNLTFNSEKTQNYFANDMSFTKTFGSDTEYIHIDFRDTASKYVYGISITDSIVAFRRIAYEDELMSPTCYEYGVFDIHGNETAEFIKLLNNLAADETARKQEEYDEHVTKVDNIKIIYKSTINYYNEDIEWGFVTYNEVQSDSTKYSAFITVAQPEQGTIFYVLSTEWSKGNLLHFDGRKMMFVRDGNSDLAYISAKNNTGSVTSKDNEGYIFNVNMNFDIDKAGKITAMSFGRQHIYHTDEPYDTQNIDMLSQFNGDPMFPIVPGFDIEYNEAEVLQTEKENKTEETVKKTAETEYTGPDFLTMLRQNKSELISAKYKGTSKNKSQLNVADFASKLERILNGYSFTKSGLYYEWAEAENAIWQFRFENDTDVYPYTMYIFDNYIVIKMVLEAGVHIASENNITMYMKYDYSGTPLTEALAPHSTLWDETEPKTEVTYRDISSRKIEYEAEFEFTVDEIHKSSWIAEVIENNKVKCKLTYFNKSSMLTISGNGKSFNLMQHDMQYGKGTVYTNSIIAVDKETPIPNEMEKSGRIYTNVTTIEYYINKYNTVDDAVIAVCNDKAVSDTVDENIIGTVKKVIKIGEVKDYVTKKDTPVTSDYEKKQVFSDVPTDHWARKSIENFYYATIVRGVGNGKYAPEDHMTSEHFGFLLNRLFGYEYSNTSQTPAIRQDVIKALICAMNLDEETDNTDKILSVYSDASLVKSENKDCLAIAVENGIVEGYAGSLNANGNLTRAEAITLIDRAVRIVYDIDDSVKPEYYKTKIVPNKDGYTVISASNLILFRLWNSDKIGNEVYIGNPSDRMTGKMIFTFGNDILSDTRVFGVFEVDGDIYTAECTEFMRLNFNKPNYRLRGAVTVYKNGTIYGEFNVWMYANTQDNEMSFGNENTYFRAEFDTLRKTLGKEPRNPDKQPEDEYLDKWADGSLIAGGMYGCTIGGYEFSEEELSKSYFNINYSNKNDDAQISIKIPRIDNTGTVTSQYVIENSSISKISDTEITGVFNVKKDGELIYSNIPAKISNIQFRLKSKSSFMADGGEFNITLYNKEVSK